MDEPNSNKRRLNADMTQATFGYSNPDTAQFDDQVPTRQQGLRNPSLHFSLERYSRGKQDDSPWVGFQLPSTTPTQDAPFSLSYLPVGLDTIDFPSGVFPFDAHTVGADSGYGTGRHWLLGSAASTSSLHDDDTVTTVAGSQFGEHPFSDSLSVPTFSRPNGPWAYSCRDCLDSFKTRSQLK
jgi:hypothetical protein